jgi:hypothetical protein
MCDEIAMLLWMLTERDSNRFVVPGLDPGIGERTRRRPSDRYARQ